MLIEKPGIYKELPNDDYHKSKGISNSGIGELIEPNCPANYFYKYLSGKYVKPERQHFVLGSAVHTLVLEPETFESRFFIAKKINRQSTAGKEAHAIQQLEAGTKQMLTEAQYDQAQYMAINAMTHPLIKTQLKNGCIEDSLAWEDQDSGALLRTRPDYYNEDFILDFKTTKDISADSFSRTINEYGYHRQGAMACDGLNELTGIDYETVILFLASIEPPYLVRAFSIEIPAIQKGRREYKKGAATYQQCLKNNYWPGYPEMIEDINLPHWAYRGDDYDD